ncbi:MAG TPA: hypothetical protein VN960_11970, partial [Gaiellaceae bacterium]|nr:hypothetical protein [Gaiellaceae bacterium]
FLADGRAGLSLHRAGRLEEAAELLDSAEASYTGDFLEEDLYADWAVSLREEVRAAYIAVAGALARRDGLHWPHRDGLKWPHPPSGFLSFVS